MRALGFSASSTIPVGAKLRVTWGERHSLNPDGLFAPRFATIQSRVQPEVGAFVPVVRPYALPGGTAAVGDYINHAPRLGADLIGALAMLNDDFVEVKSVELLTGAAAAAITTDAGARARDALVTETAALGASSNPIAQLARGFGTTVKVVAVALVVVLALVIVLELRK